MADFHQKNPLVAGIGKEELREQVEASSEVFAAALDIARPGEEACRLPEKLFICRDAAW